MPVADLPLLVEAAQDASEIALKYWRSDQRVDLKEGNSPVSEGDFAVDGYLRDRLMSARPSYAWLSEETDDDLARLQKSRSFIVDPIDGTRAYVAGERTWGISIAVVEDGQPTAGVVYLPARQKLYAAACGQGATLNGSPIAAGARAEPDGAELLTTRQSMAEKWWANPPPKVTRHWRSSLAYRFCLVAEGRFDGVLTIRDAHEWDIAAGALMVTEAGGRISDRHGAALRFNSRCAKAQGVFAAPPRLHERLIALYSGRPRR